MDQKKEIEELKRLYAESSKHSNYQILPNSLVSIIGKESLLVKSRNEKERLDFIINNLTITSSEILDIGGNSGFFSFSLIERGAKKVHHFEGNKFHSKFVNLASRILDVENKIQTTNSYFEFDNSYKANYDIILLLNVLHHLGDDYGEEKENEELAKVKMIEQLNQLAGVTKFLVFQLGFNWMGDIEKPLFKNGTKEEVIDFVSNGVSEHWEILEIGIAELIENTIIYKKPTVENLIRRNDLGEFLNRPIFILRSKI